MTGRFSERVWDLSCCIEASVQESGAPESQSGQAWLSCLVEEPHHIQTCQKQVQISLTLAGRDCMTLPMVSIIGGVS